MPTVQLKKKSSTFAVIQDALRLISQSLDKIGIDMDSLLAVRWPGAKEMPDSSRQCGASASLTVQENITTSSEMDYCFFGDVVYSDVQVDPEIVEVFSRLQPISVSVGALDNS